MTDLVNYQGRKVPREGFRVFVFGQEGATKLVNSYEEYQVAIEKGWCSTRDEVPHIEAKKMVQVDLASLTDLESTKKGQKNRRG